MTVENDKLLNSFENVQRLQYLDYQLSVKHTHTHTKSTQVVASSKRKQLVSCDQFSSSSQKLNVCF